MELKEFFSMILLPASVFALVFLFGLILRRIFFSYIDKIAQKTSSQLDDILISAIRFPSLLWFLMLAVYFGIDVSALPDAAVVKIGRSLGALGIFSVTWALANIVSNVIKAYSAKIAAALPATSLTRNIARILVMVVGVLVMLNYLGISIAPILATLGVGGLAVALALQDTLANLFSGFHVMASDQVRVGDYIKLESGEEGYVTDINWRNTKIRMLPNNVVIVPNSKLSQAIVTNYYLPDKEMALVIQVGVHYGSDLDRVERVTCETAREVIKITPGAVSSFEPFIRYHTFNQSSIDFSVILRIKEFADQHLVKHQFIKALHARYAKEGIVIPYPIRAINYSQEKAAPQV